MRLSSDVGRLRSRLPATTRQAVAKELARPFRSAYETARVALCRDHMHAGLARPAVYTNRERHARKPSLVHPLVVLLLERLIAHRPPATLRLRERASVQRAIFHLAATPVLSARCVGTSRSLGLVAEVAKPRQRSKGLARSASVSADARMRRVVPVASPSPKPDALRSTSQAMTAEVAGSAGAKMRSHPDSRSRYGS